MKLAALVIGLFALVVALQFVLASRSAESAQLPPLVAGELPRTPEFVEQERDALGTSADPISDDRAARIQACVDETLAPDGKPWSTEVTIGGYDKKETFRIVWSGNRRQLFRSSGELYAERTYENRLCVGTTRAWHRNGRLWSEEEYRAGSREGPSVVYSAEGALLARGSYRAGFRDGAWEEWHREGARRAVGSYRAEPERCRQQKIGHWTFWKQDGSIDAANSGDYVDDVRARP